MSVRTPPARTIDQAIDRRLLDNKWTPDINHLSWRYSYLPVFVYGSEQKHYSNAELTQNFPRVGVGTTYGDHWTMYKTPDNEAAVFYQPEHRDSAKIYGELYVVPPEVIFLMDEFLCFGVHFIRRWETIIYREPDDIGKSECQLYSTDAIIYSAHETGGHFSKWLPTAKPMRLFTEQDLRYYRFMLHDDAPNREVI